MRVTIKVDSATPEEVYDLTLAFQRTRHDHGLPAQITKEPTVTVGGIRMGWVSPAMRRERAFAVMEEYERLQGERVIPIKSLTS